MHHHSPLWRSWLPATALSLVISAGLLQPAATAAEPGASSTPVTAPRAPASPVVPPAAAPGEVLGAGSWYVSSNFTAGDWSKTGLFYDTPWADRVDCVAGGNTTLELYIKALTPHTLEVVNAKKLAVSLIASPDATHAQATASANLGDYVQLTDLNWTRVAIPMAAFKDFNFRAVISFIGIPTALGAGDFSLGVDEIRFVGGPTPVVWYGDAHPSNPIAPHGVMVVNGITVPAVEAHFVAHGGVDLSAMPPGHPAP